MHCTGGQELFWGKVHIIWILSDIMSLCRTNRHIFQRNHNAEQVLLLLRDTEHHNNSNISHFITALIAGFMGPTWGPSGAYRTQVGPMLAPWTLLSGCTYKGGLKPSIKKIISILHMTFIVSRPIHYCLQSASAGTVPGWPLSDVTAAYVKQSTNSRAIIYQN